ncbi:FxLYD domain-containing protein [Kitasatospora sp. NPDC058201]|uniref:FxLYD domain-containing protein n=1 Tax=unclassified Kitasatospora TaxID=2633591 RepID=UPI00365F08B1
MRRTTLSITAVSLAVLGLAACDPSITTSTPTGPAVEATTAGAPPAPGTPAPTLPAAVPTLPTAVPSLPAAPGNADATGDVELTSCDVDATLHWPSAQLKVTNRSSKSSNYMIQVEFVDAAGTRIGEGLAATNNLAAGQAATLKAQGAVETKGKISCKVTNVTRYASL